MGNTDAGGPLRLFHKQNKATQVPADSLALPQAHREMISDMHLPGHAWISSRLWSVPAKVTLPPGCPNPGRSPSLLGSGPCDAANLSSVLRIVKAAVALGVALTPPSSSGALMVVLC